MSRHVYVIELAPAAGRRRDPRIPWVYVGSSAREPEIRFEQHRRGYRSAGIVRRHGVRLRPDLFADIGPLRGSREAEAAEAERARELAGCGFVAHSDGVSHGAEGGDWREWDAARLGRVGGLADVAAGALAEAAFEPLDPDTCARLLRGERGFWVARHLDPADPPPGYGMFAHVSHKALAERAASLPALAP